MPDSPSEAGRPIHPIQVAARRSGLTPDLLRAWERRYGVVTPSRTPGSHRLYSDEEIEKLRLVHDAVNAGRRIGQVARMGQEELRRLVDSDRPFPQTPAPGREDAVPAPPGPARLGACLAAIEALNQEELARILEKEALSQPVPALIEELVQPLLETVGREWVAGRLRICHEHLTSAVLRTFLDSLRCVRPAPAGAPHLLVGTPAGQHHEFGALITVLFAEADGWRVTYLGTNLPAEELAAAAAQTEARALALSISFPPDDPHLARDLKKLGKLLSPGFPVLVGGGAAAAYGRILDEFQALRLPDHREFRRRLESLRWAPL